MEKRVKHRSVKFSPEEMSYDVPADTDLRRWKPAGRGPAAILAKTRKRSSVDLEPDVAKVFRTSQAVNSALRLLMQTASRVAGKPKKIA